MIPFVSLDNLISASLTRFHNPAARCHSQAAVISSPHLSPRKQRLSAPSSFLLDMSQTSVPLLYRPPREATSYPRAAIPCDSLSPWLTEFS